MRLFYLLFSFFIISLSGLQAQSSSKISGRVTDGNGIPLSYANIVINETKTSTEPDEKGNFLLKLPEGRYRISAKVPGYLSSDTVLTVGKSGTANISFRLLSDGRLLQEALVPGVKVKTAAATRTLMQIQDVPQSVAVMGQKVITQQAAFDLTTIVRNISGVNFSGNYSGAGSSQFFNARGFDLNDAQNYRWNGMMIWNFGNNYGDNIEQVEFLKGPTSILFGDVSPAGVMNLVTKKPLANFQGAVNFKTGSWGLVRPSLDITGPLTADRSLRFRLNTSYEQSNSFRDHVSSRRTLVAPSLTWDITPELSLQLEAVISSSSSTDDAGLVSPDGTIAGLRKLKPSLYLGEPSLRYLYKSQHYFARLQYALSRAWTVKTTLFYGNIINRPSGIWFDQPDEKGHFARRIYGFNQRSGNGSGSVDLTGSFFTGSIKHQVVAGADYQYTRNRYTNAGELSLLDTSNIFQPVYGRTPLAEPARSPYRPYFSMIARSGLFLQDQLMFLEERLHLLLGIRAGSTRQGNHYFQDQLPGTPYEGYKDDIISKNVLIPRVGLVYKPRNWVSLYASYSKGYEVNSPDVFAKNYNEFASPPATTSNQIEVGSKTNLLADKFGLTLSLFQINKHHPYGYVYLNPENPDYDVYNVYYQGHHRSRGIELDADGKISSSLSVTAAAAFTSTRVIQDPGYPAGNSLPNAPRLTGNIWISYNPSDKLKGLSFGAGLFYKDKFFPGIANDPALEIPRSYTLDVSAGYQYKRASIQLNVMNVTNQVSYLNPWLFNLFDVRPLRQVVLTLTCRFGKIN